MRFRVWPGPILLLLICVLPVAAQEADTGVRYISDETAITLREDKGMNAPVAALLKSGTRVELLQTDASSGYARVRGPQGREGWVLARYLSTEPAARERLVAVQSRLAELQALAHKLEAENARLRAAAVATPASAEPATADCPEPTAAVAAPVQGPGEIVSQLTGAGLFVAGLLGGLLIPLILHRDGRRKSRWSADL